MRNTLPRLASDDLFGCPRATALPVRNGYVVPDRFWRIRGHFTSLLLKSRAGYFQVVRIRPIYRYGIKLADGHEITCFTTTRPEMFRHLLYFGTGITARASRAAAVVHRSDEFPIQRFHFRNNRIVAMGMLHECRIMTRTESDNENKNGISE